MVSQQYINMTYSEENNLKHEIKVFNVTRNFELTDFLEIDDLSINKFLENESNAISPNTLNLSFMIKEIEREKLAEYFDEEEGIFDRNVYFKNLKEVREYLVKEDDEIKVIDILNNEEIILFFGIAKELSYREEILHKYLNITVKDKTIDGYNRRFDKEYIYKDYYVFNSNEKQRSLLYILAQKIGFTDALIEIEDIKYSLGDFIKIPIAKFEKDNNIMQELAELVRAVVGNVYVKSDGTLRITSLINQKDTRIIDYTLKRGNILEYLENNQEKAIQNKIEVEYTENKIEPEQVIFALAGQNANAETDNANVIIKANTTENDILWQIDYVTSNVSNIRPDPEIVAYKANSDGTRTLVEYSEYEMYLEENTGRIKFLNTKNFDIFIEKFKIYGQPIYEYEGNKVYYTEKKLESHEIELKTISNKYIQELRLAQENSKYNYFINCRNFNKYSLVCNSLPFIELEDVVNIDYGDLIRKMQVINIVQHAGRTELVLKEFEIYRPDAGRWENHQINLLDKNLLRNGGTVDFGRIKYPENKPPAVIGVTAEHQFLGFGIRWQALENNDIKGYFMYIKSIDEGTGQANGILDTKVSCGNATYKVIKADVGSYEVYITALNMNGIEGDKSETVIARSIKVDGTAMNVDGESLVIDTTTNKLVLGTVLAKNMAANSIIANSIAANAVTAEKIEAEAVTTEKLMFSEKDGLFKDENGGIGIKGDKLTITARTIFNSDVSLNGKIIGENGVIVEHGNKMTTIRGGTITFHEKNNQGHFIMTRAFRKMATDIYNFNPHAIAWVDVRRYSGNIDWNNVKVTASLTRFNVDTNVRQILCEVVRHPHDRHLFYVRVGGSNIVEQGWEMVADNYYAWDRNYTPPLLSFLHTKNRWLQEGVFGAPQIVQDLYYTGISKMRVEFSNSNKRKILKFWTTWEHGKDNTSTAESESFITYNMVYRVRHKQSGTHNWSDWHYYTSNNFDTLNQGTKFDINIQMVVSNFTINRDGNGAIQAGVVNSYYDRGLLTWYDTRGNGNLKVWISRSIEGQIAGGQATWWAYED